MITLSVSDVDTLKIIASTGAEDFDTCTNECINKTTFLIIKKIRKNG
jgi:hypothetical protein